MKSPQGPREDRYLSVFVWDKRHYLVVSAYFKHLSLAILCQPVTYSSSSESELSHDKSAEDPPKTAEDLQRLHEDFRSLPKISQDGLKIFKRHQDCEHFQKSSKDFLKLLILRVIQFLYNCFVYIINK